MEFVVGSVAAGQFFLLVLWFFPVNVIAKVIHIYLCCFIIVAVSSTVK